MRTHCIWLLVLIIACLSAWSGCDRGPALPARGRLTGKVTLNSKPLPEGTVRFLAIDPNGINAIAQVKDGQYALAEDAGPAKGKYRVEFSVLSKTKQRVPNDDVPGTFMEIAPETLPPRYHRDSQITIDYNPEEQKSYDFSLATP
jgi:hypothetical protein